MPTATASLIACPICQRPSPVAFAGYPGYRAPDLFDICHCEGCRTEFVRFDGRDLSDLYDRIYDVADEVPGYSRYARMARMAARSPKALDDLAALEVMYYGVREVALARGRGARVLEIGSGLGYLTYALHQAGFKATGIDISDVALRKAQKRFGRGLFAHANLFDLARTSPGQYDLVVMTEVIEHLPDPYPFLRAALAMLAPGGELLATTPNRDAFAPSIPWEVDRPPVHLFWFTADSLREIAQRLGVGVEFADLSGFRAAWAPPVANDPLAPHAPKESVLDSGGDPRFFTGPVGRAKRRVRSVMRRFGLLDEPLPLPAAPAEVGPDAVCSTLCAVFRPE